MRINGFKTGSLGHCGAVEHSSARDTRRRKFRRRLDQRPDHRVARRDLRTTTPRAGPNPDDLRQAQRGDARILDERAGRTSVPGERPQAGMIRS